MRRPRYTYEDVEDMLPEDMPAVASKRESQPTGIARAQKARAEKTLDKLMKFEGRTMTRRGWLDQMLLVGKPKIYRERQYDAEERLAEKLRRMDFPIGNPNHPDTKRYYELKAQLKEGLYKERVGIELPSGTFYELNKTELEYFERLAKSG